MVKPSCVRKSQPGPQLILVVADQRHISYPLTPTGHLSSYPLTPTGHLSDPLTPTDRLSYPLTPTDRLSYPLTSP